MEEYYGNAELLNCKLVAFFASRNTTADASTLAHRWAEEIATTNKVVISGFHSALEREVMDILLRHKRPIIVGLGRTLYKKIPTIYHEAIKENRILFISYRNHSRHSWSNAQIRNWSIAQEVDNIVFAPYPEESMLSTLHYTLSLGNKNIEVLK